MDENKTNRRLNRGRRPIMHVLAALLVSAPVESSSARVRGWDPSVARRWAT